MLINTWFHSSKYYDGNKDNKNVEKEQQISLSGYMLLLTMNRAIKKRSKELIQMQKNNIAIAND